MTPATYRARRLAGVCVTCARSRPEPGRCRCAECRVRARVAVRAAVSRRRAWVARMQNREAAE